RELSGRRAKVRLALRSNRVALESTSGEDARRTGLEQTLQGLTNRWSALDQELNQLTATQPDAKRALLEREKVLGQLGGNREKQAEPDRIVKTRGKDVQFWQETGGLLGRMALAALLAAAISRGTLLRLFQLPGLIVLPLTYLWLFREQPALFQ